MVGDQLPHAHEVKELMIEVSIWSIFFHFIMQDHQWWMQLYRESLKGSSKVVWNQVRKLLFCLPSAGRRTQLFNHIISQSGKSFLLPSEALEVNGPSWQGLRYGGGGSDHRNFCEITCQRLHRRSLRPNRHLRPLCSLIWPPHIKVIAPSIARKSIGPLPSC